MEVYKDVDILKFETGICSCFGLSLIGGRTENQDSLGAIRINSDDAMLTVCDGMGGAKGGATASALAVDTILDTAASYKPGDKGLTVVAEAGKRANECIYERSLADTSLRGMGSTTTMVLVDAKAAYIGHVGDSRVYQIRGSRKIFRTTDHSVVFEMVGRHEITEEAARTHPRSNIITRALGIRPDVDVAVCRQPYRKGDRFVLCCDGIWGVMPEPELIEMLSADETPEKVARSLARRVDEIGHAKGGHHDNLTILIADMLTDSQYTGSLIKDIFSGHRK